ncbi:hypothetical protein [Lachnobacterium bovis]|uniref:Uncharacterized protein n=1 Tax=Lachnobacterium bovis TaxID=140626 RepID=A0A1H9PXV6_9FIRM|nr:hypothetical protein [Lachnobacterium bovis]SER52958.1 hypothetical protein SAMN02910429_00362 [Lachnobacterium bovis]
MEAVIVLSVHLLFVILFFVLSYKDLVTNSRLMLALVVFIPFVGTITFLVMEYFLRFHVKKARSIFSFIKDKADKNEIMVKDDNFSDYSTLRSNNISSDDAIPLEDALVMDDRQMRRHVMLDVLMDSSGNHAHSAIINKARLNDDVEVVHYATTATIQITDDFEKKLINLAKKYKEAKGEERFSVLDEYINTLEIYLNTGILQGNNLRIHQETYNQLLAERSNNLNDIEDYEKLANSYIKMGQFNLAEIIINEMVELWPNSEHTWLTQIRFLTTLKRGNELHELITRIKNGSFYKSKKLQEIIEFWDY